MKFLSNMLVAIVVLLSITNSFAQITKAEIVATGLTCSMCSNAINKQLKKLPEVENVAIDLNTNTFTISLKKNNNISPRILKESVQKAGFFVGSMIVTMDFDNQKIVDNSKLKKDNLNLIFIDTNSKTLNGLEKFKILDKGYLVMKDFKKNLKFYSKYASYNLDNEDDYHLKTL
jgi:copper chaperone CopZ